MMNTSSDKIKMTKEEKDLLLKDLCARQPYNVKVLSKYTDLGETIELDGIVKMIDNDGVVGIEVINDFSSAWTCVQIDNVKPYLFPLSSMTEEQKFEFNILQVKTLKSSYATPMECITILQWCYKNHIDVNGLIPLGLAKDATGLNIY